MTKVHLSDKDKKDFNLLLGTPFYRIALLNFQYYKLMAVSKEELDSLALDMSEYYLYVSPEIEKNEFLYLQLRTSGFNIGLNKNTVQCSKIDRGNKTPSAIQQGNSVSLGFSKSEKSFYFYTKKSKISKFLKTSGLIQDNNIILEEVAYFKTWFLISKDLI